jgi:hypothetical protein
MGCVTLGQPGTSRVRGGPELQDGPRHMPDTRRENLARQTEGLRLKASTAGYLAVYEDRRLERLASAEYGILQRLGRGEA